jgi:pentatricopeptide repeat protein
MFFFIPIRTDKETRNLPNFTIGLIAINLIIWIFTNNVITRQMQEMSAIQDRLLEIEIPYLMPRIQENPDLLNGDSPDEIHDFVLKEQLVPKHDEVYEEWLALLDEYGAISQNTLFLRWGFIPSQLNLLKMLSSLFIHANFMHVFFNMLFLWLVGCNIEEDWKWKKFIGFYLLSGIVACLFHASFFAGSGIPLIGASGAIAGVMGAFMIQHFKTKIRFAYFIWLILKPRFGMFSVSAGVVLPFWFLLEFFSAQWSSVSGTAHWAHVGGFVFGGLFGLGSKYFEARKEETLLEQSGGALPAETDEGLPPALAGVDPELLPVAAESIPLLHAFLQAQPDHLKARLQMARISLHQGFQDDAMVTYNRVIDHLFQNKQPETIFSIYHELQQSDLLSRLSSSNMYQMGVFLKTRQYYKGALSMFSSYIKRYPQGPMRPRAIYESALILKRNLHNDKLARSAIGFLKREYPDFSPRTG